jgi:hypothetical protein
MLTRGYLMAANRIVTQIYSETLYVPQLRPLVGKRVEILVQEKAVPEVRLAARDWVAVESAVLAIEDNGADAYREARAVS